MRIGIDGNEANLENRVGVNQYAAELLRALEKLPQAKSHEWIIYLKERPLPHLPKERKGWRYKILPGRGLWVLRKLMFHLWFTKNRPDVFFTPSHYTPPFLPMPMVMSVMDLGYLRFPEQFRKYDLYQLKYWGQWSMRRARNILAISESTKKEIIEHYPWTAGKVVVTYPGYDKEKYQISKTKNQKDILKIKKKYGIEGEYILFLSTLKPSKNLEGLLDAFARIGETNINLVVAGRKGWLYQSIFRKVKDLGLEKRVIFTDFVSEEEKLSLVAGARLLASPSFWEGFGMHVLEAMALGVPVVVSDVGSLPKIVGGVGFVVDPYNSQDIAEGLKKVVSLSQTAYNKLSKELIIQARRFDWGKTAMQTLEILKEASNV